MGNVRPSRWEFVGAHVIDSLPQSGSGKFRRAMIDALGERERERDSRQQLRTHTRPHTRPHTYTAHAINHQFPQRRAHSFLARRAGLAFLRRASVIIIITTIVIMLQYSLYESCCCYSDHTLYSYKNNNDNDNTVASNHSTEKSRRDGNEPSFLFPLHRGARRAWIVMSRCSGLR
jgi:hypothetical protein